MSKIADYFITGVWKDTQERITDVMLHPVNDNNKFNQTGKKTSRVDVVSLLKRNNSIMTITWSYPEWSSGAYITHETIGNVEYLKTVPNSTIKDNLDNSFPFN